MASTTVDAGNADADALVVERPSRNAWARWRDEPGGLLTATLLLLAVAIALYLRVRDLTARSLWVDELFTVGLAAQPIATVLRVLYGEEANMTLFYLVMFGWVRLVGASASELWMRLPSVVFGVLGALALYRLGSRFGGRATGLLAAILLAVNAYHVEMSQEARAYTLWALLLTLSWDALIEALDTGRRPAWLRYVAWTTLAFYAHFFTVFVVLAQCLVVLNRWRYAEWRALFLSGLGVIVLSLPFVPFFVVNDDGSQILHVRPSDVGDLLDLFTMFAGSTDPLLLASAVVAVFGVITTVLPALRARDRASAGRALAPLLWLVVPVLTVYVLSYVKPMFRERYLFGAMPAISLLVAIGISRIRPRLLRPLVAVALIALAVVPLARGLSIRQDENWRAAVAYLDTNALPDDGWIFISKRAQLGYEYYAGWLASGQPVTSRPDILEGFDWNDLADSQTYYRALTSGTSRLPEFTARHQRIWLVLSHEFDSTFDGDTSAAVRDWLTRRGYSARQRTFQNIRILLYERRS